MNMVALNYNPHRYLTDQKTPDSQVLSKPHPPTAYGHCSPLGITSLVRHKSARINFFVLQYAMLKPLFYALWTEPVYWPNDEQQQYTNVQLSVYLYGNLSLSPAELFV